MGCRCASHCRHAWPFTDMRRCPCAAAMCCMLGLTWRVWCAGESESDRPQAQAVTAPYVGAVCMGATVELCDQQAHQAVTAMWPDGRMLGAERAPSL